MRHEFDSLLADCRRAFRGHLLPEGQMVGFSALLAMLILFYRAQMRIGPRECRSVPMVESAPANKYASYRLFTS